LESFWGDWAWTNAVSYMSWKKLVFLKPGEWTIHFSWGSVDDFDSVAALKRGAVAFEKCFGMKSGSVKQ
jgi:hypothetical protein